MQQAIRLDGKTALVTGASSGLGWRFAQVLAQAGARVALAARRTDKLEQLKQEIEQAGGNACVVRMDVTDVASVHAAVAAAELPKTLVERPSAAVLRQEAPSELSLFQMRDGVRSSDHCDCRGIMRTPVCRAEPIWERQPH